MFSSFLRKFIIQNPCRISRTTSRAWGMPPNSNNHTSCHRVTLKFSQKEPQLHNWSEGQHKHKQPNIRSERYPEYQRSHTWPEGCPDMCAIHPRPHTWSEVHPLICAEHPKPHKTSEIHLEIYNICRISNTTQRIEGHPEICAEHLNLTPYQR